MPPPPPRFHPRNIVYPIISAAQTEKNRPFLISRGGNLLFKFCLPLLFLCCELRLHNIYAAFASGKQGVGLVVVVVGGVITFEMTVYVFYIVLGAHCLNVIRSHSAVNVSSCARRRSRARRAGSPSHH